MNKLWNAAALATVVDPAITSNAAHVKSKTRNKQLSTQLSNVDKLTVHNAAMLSLYKPFAASLIVSLELASTVAIRLFLNQ